MIIAVDFDGVIVEDAFPEIGEPNWQLVELLRQCMKKTDHEFILWTSRVDQPAVDAYRFCTEELDLWFTRVNEAAPSNLEKYRGMYSKEPRKVYADVYIDDRAVGYSMGRAKRFLAKLIEEEQK